MTSVTWKDRQNYKGGGGGGGEWGKKFGENIFSYQFFLCPLQRLLPRKRAKSRKWEGPTRYFPLPSTLFVSAWAWKRPLRMREPFSPDDCPHGTRGALLTLCSSLHTKMAQFDLDNLIVFIKFLLSYSPAAFPIWIQSAIWRPQSQLELNDQIASSYLELEPLIYQYHAALLFQGKGPLFLLFVRFSAIVFQPILSSSG